MSLNIDVISYIFQYMFYKLYIQVQKLYPIAYLVVFTLYKPVYIERTCDSCRLFIKTPMYSLVHLNWQFL